MNLHAEFRPTQTRYASRNGGKNCRTCQWGMEFWNRTGRCRRFLGPLWATSANLWRPHKMKEAHDKTPEYGPLIPSLSRVYVRVCLLVSYMTHIYECLRSRTMGRQQPKTPPKECPGRYLSDIKRDKYWPPHRGQQLTYFCHQFRRSGQVYINNFSYSWHWGRTISFCMSTFMQMSAWEKLEVSAHNDKKKCVGHIGRFGGDPPRALELSISAESKPLHELG